MSSTLAPPAGPAAGPEAALDAGSGGDRQDEGRFAAWALPAALAGLTIWFGFAAGGYFADTMGWAAAGLLVALAVLAAAGRVIRGMTWPLALAAAALAAFAVLVLVSSAWSQNVGRALIEFERVLLYLAALLLFGTCVGGVRTLRRLPVAFVLGVAVLCGAGVLVRTVPGAWPFALPPLNPRLAYPVSYENGLAALAAIGLVLGLHVAAWERSRVVRALAAATLPLMTTALVLTFSRGGALAALVGVLAYCVAGRTRLLATTLVAVAVPTFLAARVAFDADLLATVHNRSAAATAQGHDVALAVVLAMIVAAGLMVAMAPLERRLMRARLPFRPPSPRVTRLAALGVVLAAAVALVASGAFGDLADRVAGPNGSAGTATRDRLTDTTTYTQSRTRYWRVALDGFAAQPLRGNGAGSFGQLWARDRPTAEDADEGHSIYIETLAEFGVIGGALLVLVLGTLLWPLAARLRGPQRPLYAAGGAAALAWLLHAALDWDWEMPVLTLWLFAFCGAALGLSRRRLVTGRAGGWPVRALAAAGFALLTLAPLAVAVSQVRLDRAEAALERHDCAAAVSGANGAIDVLPVRAEGYAIRGWCEARAGDGERAAASMRAAIDRDPRNWEFHYDLAVVRAAAGVDPRRAVRAAVRLNPLDGLVIAARRDLGHRQSPRSWQRAAAKMAVPVRNRITARPR